MWWVVSSADGRIINNDEAKICRDTLQEEGDPIPAIMVVSKFCPEDPKSIAFATEVESNRSRTQFYSVVYTNAEPDQNFFMAYYRCEQYSLNTPLL